MFIDYTKVKVKAGDEVKAGDPLTEGSINPADLLSVKGAEGVYTYIIAEVQKNINLLHSINQQIITEKVTQLLIDNAKVKYTNK